MFVADTVAKTCELQGMLKGAAINTVLAIVHYRFWTMVAVAPLHVLSTGEYPPSFYRIKTVYAVIKLPPLSGAVQLTITLVPLTVVVGATGIAGSCAASTLNGLEDSEKPNEFLAFTVNT
jgi:hypothetical protein